jgi:invasion protein IalB
VRSPSRSEPTEVQKGGRREHDPSGPATNCGAPCARGRRSTWVAPRRGRRDEHLGAGRHRDRTLAGSHPVGRRGSSAALTELIAHQSDQGRAHDHKRRRRVRGRLACALPALILCSLSSCLSLAQANPPSIAQPQDSSPSPPSGSSPIAAPAALPSAASVTRFEDWELICERVSDSAPIASPADSSAPASATRPPQQDAPRGACRVAQRLAVKGSGETVFLVSIRPAGQPGQRVAIISTPLGGYLVPGMELRIDKAKPVRVLYETCLSRLGAAALAPRSLAPIRLFSRDGRQEARFGGASHQHWGARDQSARATKAGVIIPLTSRRLSRCSAR